VDAGHVAAIGLTGVELLVMVAVATLFSAFTTPMLASIFSLGIYVLGHLTRDLLALGQQSDSAGLQALTQWIYRLLPDLESFNLTIQAAHGLAIPAGEIWWPVLYGVLYASVLLTGAVHIFRTRDLR
jgi:Cu-processing system permease protein